MARQARIGDLVLYTLPSGVARPGILVEVHRPGLDAETAPGESDLVVFWAKATEAAGAGTTIMWGPCASTIANVVHDPGRKPFTWDYREERP